MAKYLAMLSWCFFSCTTLDFRSSGAIRAKVSPQEGHKHFVEVEGRKEFYVWGTIPERHRVDVDKLLADRGFVSAANITVHEYTSWGSLFKSIFSFGLYTPRNYKVTGFGIKTTDED